MRRNGENPNNPDVLSVGKDASQPHAIIPSRKDKAASIRFKRPGKETLFADFRLSETEIAEIKQILETEKSVDRIYHVELKSHDGTVHAIIEKTIYISRKNRIND